MAGVGGDDSEDDLMYSDEDDQSDAGDESGDELSTWVY
jgi:hypothetical protein